MASSWNTLPPEVRLLILRCIIPQYGLAKSSVESGFPKASLLATVSREWQDFFERHTFRQMTLVSTDLHAFHRHVKGNNAIRLNYITNIWLYVKLANYTNHIADKPESVTNTTLNNKIFTEAMAVLLKAISSWQGNHGGLTLEIHSQSPSDLVFHSYIYELHDDFPFRFEDEVRMWPTILKFYRTKKRQRIQRRGHMIAPSRVLDVNGKDQRLCGSPLELNPSLVKKHHPYSPTIRNLPNIPIVKGLILRRNARRGVAVKSIAKLCRESFVNLESVRIESWLGQTLEQDKAFVKDLETDLMPALPNSIQRFNLQRGWPRIPGTLTTMADQITLLSGRWCHKFTEFCPPFEIDTFDFLGEIVRAGRCEHSKLQHLSVVARYLGHKSTQIAATRCLLQASQAAKNLPRLRTLELWSSGGGCGFLFRCELDDSRVRITWIYTDKRFVLEPEVEQSWAEVASTRVFDVRRFSLRKVVKVTGPFRSPSMLPYLKLRRLVFDPITEAQMIVKEALHR